MNTQHDDYKVVPYPKLRRVLALMYRSVQRKPMTHGLLDHVQTDQYRPSSSFLRIDAESAL